MLNGLDLFSGIGGMSFALVDMVRPVAYCENNRYAANDAMFNPNAPAVVETWVRWVQLGLFLSGAGLVVITKGFK